MLARLLDEQPQVRDAVDAELAAASADPDALDALLSIQNYPLAYWRAAGRDLGYRRFFDITTLIGLRVEDKLVFDDSHVRLKRWIDDGVLDGIRVDHPDGLLDPTTYTQRLRRVAAPRLAGGGEDPHARRGVAPGLARRRHHRLRLPAATPSSLLVDPGAEAAFSELHARLTGETRSFDAVTRETRDLIVRETLGSELNRLTAVFVAICENQRRFRDYTRHELHEACEPCSFPMPVYRTYARPHEGVISDQDRRIIEHRHRRGPGGPPGHRPELLGFLGDILTLGVNGEAEGELAGRFQQLSGAVMAKGIEDTAFYRYVRLVALNDVGCEPGRFGLSVEAYHAANCARAADWPAADADDVDARHQAQRGRPCPHRRAFGDARPLATHRRALDASLPSRLARAPASTRSSAISPPRPSWAPGPSMPTACPRTC